MSMDRCKLCESFVDTDFDSDCYDNPKQHCICERCREENMNDDDLINEAAERAEQAQTVGSNYADTIFQALKPLNARIIQNPQTFKDIGKEI